MIFLLIFIFWRKTLLSKSNIFKGLSLFLLMGFFQEASAYEAFTRAKECPKGNEVLQAYSQLYTKYKAEFLVKTENIISQRTLKNLHLFLLDKKKSEKLAHPKDVQHVFFKEEDISFGSKIRCKYSVTHTKKKWDPTKKLFGKVYDKSVNDGKVKSVLILESNLDD